jgi:hypothetical protein
MRLSPGFAASAGIAQEAPNMTQPSILPSLQSVLMRLIPMPHFSEASFIVMYSFIFSIE